MIQSKKDYLFYIEADRIAKGLPKKYSLAKNIKRILLTDKVWKFQKTLRKLEYYKNSKTGIFSLIYRYYLTRKFNKLSIKLGYTIPTNVFGPGLSIAHHGTIIVNRGVKIGANCRIHACVNIGTEAGYVNKAPKIGDNCYIGPGVKIYGDINIADGIAIGANSVVNKSFNETNIAIAGAPAKKIGGVNTLKLLIPGSLLVNSSIYRENLLSGLPANEVFDMIKSEAGIL